MQVNKLKGIRYLTKDYISKKFQIDREYEYEEIKAANKLLNNDMIVDYKKLIKNIANCMEIHSTYYRNYKV